MRLFNIFKRKRNGSSAQGKQAPTPMLFPDFSCSLPINYYIEPTNVCNLKCPFCTTGKGQNHRPKRMMSLAEYAIILGRIAPTAKVVSLFNCGESFLNKDLLKMIKLTSELKIYTCIPTNLSIEGLDPEAIVRSGLSRIIIAIDGVNQATYEKSRVGGDFGLVMANMRGLQQAKMRLNSKTPVIQWRYLVHKFNEHDLDKAKKMAAEIGVEITLKYLVVEDSDWESSFQQRDDIRSADCIKRSSQKEYPISAASLPCPIDKIVFHPDLIGVCYQLFKQMVINCDGLAYPCTAAYHPEMALGSILETPLEGLWNNQAYRRCRNYLFGYGRKKVNNGSICARDKCPLVKTMI